MRCTAANPQAIAQDRPRLEQLADIDRTKQEFQIGGRTFHEPQFATPDGRAGFTRTTCPSCSGTGDRRDLRLMTIRSEGQFNTVVYEDDDIYRGIERRDVILLHPDDLARFGLATEHASPSTARPARCPTSARPRSPRSSRATPRCTIPSATSSSAAHVDPQSKTPAFKGVVVQICAANVMRPAYPDTDPAPSAAASSCVLFRGTSAPCGRGSGGARLCAGPCGTSRSRDDRTVAGEFSVRRS